MKIKPLYSRSESDRLIASAGINCLSAANSHSMESAVK